MSKNDNLKGILQGVFAAGFHSAKDASVSKSEVLHAAYADITGRIEGLIGDDHFDDGDPQTLGRNSEKQEVRQRMEEL